MWDFSIRLSIWLVLRTLPFLVLRLAVSLVWAAILVAASFAIFTLVIAVMKVPGASKGSFNSSAWLLLVVGTCMAAGLAFLLLRWLRKWALYRVKAAHVAVLVEYVQGRALPKGMGQFRFGQTAVRERLGEAAALFLLDEMIRAALRQVNQAINRLEMLLPGRFSASRVPIQVVFHFLFSFMDEVLLAHTFDSRTQDASSSARRALKIFGESQLIILKNVFWLTVFAAAFCALVYHQVISVAWANYLAAHSPETWRNLILALVASFALLAMFFGPFALICMLQVWFRRILANGAWAPREPSRGPITAQFEPFRNAGAAVGQVGGGPRNGDLV